YRIIGDITFRSVVVSGTVIIDFLNFFNGRDDIIIGESYQPYSLGGTSHDAQLTYFDPDRKPGTVDDHQLIVIYHFLDRNKLASFRRDIERLDALTSPFRDAVVTHIRPLAKP